MKKECSVRGKNVGRVFVGRSETGFASQCPWERVLGYRVINGTRSQRRGKTVLGRDVFSLGTNQMRM